MFSEEIYFNASLANYDMVSFLGVNPKNSMFTSTYNMGLHVN